MEESISRLACKVANRVTLGILFQESTGRKSQVRQMVADAADATCGLLDLVDPVALRDGYGQFHAVFEGSRSWLEDDPQAWSEFLATQCDLMHSVKLHQKTIASLGDRLARWDRSPIAFDEFARGLDGLASLVSDHASALATAFEQETGGSIRYMHQGAWLADSVSGLALVLVAMDQKKTSSSDVGADLSNAALANFGASLTSNSVEQLFDACRISRSPEP